MVMRATIAMRIMLIVLAAMSAAGCELIGGIFKAGVWVGAIGVILLVGTARGRRRQAQGLSPSHCVSRGVIVCSP